MRADTLIGCGWSRLTRLALTALSLESAAAQECSVWRNISPPDRPVPPRSSSALAYDPSRGVTVLFGGDSNASQRSDAWEWNGQFWNQQPDAPFARSHSAMAYAGGGQGTILHGGYEGGTWKSDTWSWDGSQWTPASSGGPVRADHRMVFDSKRDAVVLHGGHDGVDMFGETWVWDGQTWQLAHADGPAVFQPAMAYDPFNEEIVVFGGISYPPYEVKGETWVLGPDGWRLAATSGPAARYGSGMCFDAVRGQVVLFGGYGNQSYFDTWAWDGHSWSLIANGGITPASSGTQLAFDTRRSVVVAQDNERTWEWNGAGWLLRSQTNPNARMGHALAYDSIRQRAVLHGGYPVFRSETWEFDGTTWSLRSMTGIPSLYLTSMVFDEQRAVCLLFGGWNDQDPPAGERNDAWEWDGSAWLQVGQGGPSPRLNHALAYDTERDMTVMFGGFSNPTNSRLGDTWLWNGTEWFDTAAVGPTPRVSSMAYDAVRDRIVLFGGRDDASFQDDTWEWDGNEWLLVGTGGPAARSSHRMLFHVGRGRAFLYGGLDSLTSVVFGDIWEWDGMHWYELRPNGTHPAPRSTHAMTYDQQSQRALIFGGAADVNRDIRLGDTWELDFMSLPLISQGVPSEDHCVGRTASLSATATGLGTLSFQWRKAGVDLVDSVRIYGAKTPTLTIDLLQTTDAGLYDCVVSNACGSTVTNQSKLGVFEPCDASCDGSVNQFDIQPFIQTLISRQGCSACAGDANDNGTTNQFDINSFIDCLIP